MKNFSSQMSCAVLLSALIFLPGCWLKEKLGLQKSDEVSSHDGGTPLASINGKTLMTVEDFEKQYKSFIEKHPYGAMFAQMEGIDRKIFEGLLSQKIMSYWVKENKYDEAPDYKEYLEQLVQMLNARYFQMKHPVTVAESDLKAFYDANKDSMPEAIVSRGGVNATGVSFAKEAEAKAFLEKAKGKGAQLEKIAKEANLGDKYRDFKVVNAMSVGVEPALREKVVAFKKFPALELVKAGDTYWIVYASGKEEQKYRSFEELKGAIEQRITAQKQEEAMEKALEQLKKDYSVVINEEYFSKKAQPESAGQIGNEEQLEMVMPGAPEESAQAKPVATTKAA